MKADETSTLKRMDDIVLELESDLNLLRTDRDKLAVENEQLKASKDQSGIYLFHYFCRIKNFRTFT
jgi:hypothetical protein